MSTMPFPGVIQKTIQGPKTLRDEFAIAALPVVAKRMYECCEMLDQSEDTFAGVGVATASAIGAYQFADAMLEARGRK